jgi:hypothetical protein
MSEPKPLLRVVRGQPSDEETAALVVALAAAVAARARAGRRGSEPPGNWAGHARALRVPPAPGPASWRRSALPG